jgi:hypothetical protein
MAGTMRCTKGKKIKMCLPRCVCFVQIIAVFLCVASGNIIAAELDDIFAKNEQFWASIRKCDLTYRLLCYEFHKIDGGKPSTVQNLKKKEFRFDYRWLDTDGCERFVCLTDEKQASVFANLSGAAVPCFDYVRNEKQTLTSEPNSANWKAKPTSLRESLQSRCTLTMLDPLNTFTVDFGGPRATFLCQQFMSATGPLQMSSLKEYAKEWSKVLPPVRSVDANGDILWTVRMEAPNWLLDANADKRNDETTREFKIELVFNESKSFYLQRYARTVPNSLSPAKDSNTGEQLDYHEETLVVDYCKLENGLYFPKCVVRGKGTEQGKSSGAQIDGISLFYKEYYYIDKVLVNDDVKDNPCYTIPEHFIVYRDDLPRSAADKDFAVCSIWGKNNEPLITFQSAAEYDEYMREHLVMPLKKAHFSAVRILLFTSGLVLVILSILMTYYFREKKT